MVLLLNDECFVAMMATWGRRDDAIHAVAETFGIIAGIGYMIEDHQM